jgi:hypothetical protein
MPRVRSLFIGLASAAIVATHAAPLVAQAISGSTSGLAGTFSTINFNGLGIGSGAPVSSQIAGVTFTPALFYAATGAESFASFPPGYLINFSGSAAAVNPFSIFFASAVNGAALQIQTDPGATTTFQAFLGATNVGSFTASTSCCGATGDFLYYGFQGITFDQLRITTSGGAEGFIAIDNLQYATAGGTEPPPPPPPVTTVPEPATMTLMATGLAGLIAARRRRKTS